VNTEQITATAIIDRNSLGDTVGPVERRGVEPRPGVGAYYERLLGIGNDEYIAVIEASPGESADDYIPESPSRHTDIVVVDRTGQGGARSEHSPPFGIRYSVPKLIGMKN